MVWADRQRYLHCQRPPFRFQRSFRWKAVLVVGFVVDVDAAKGVNAEHLSWWLSRLFDFDVGDDKRFRHVIILKVFWGSECLGTVMVFSDRKQSDIWRICERWAWMVDRLETEPRSYWYFIVGRLRWCLCDFDNEWIIVWLILEIMNINSLLVRRVHFWLLGVGSAINLVVSTLILMIIKWNTK